MGTSQCLLCNPSTDPSFSSSTWDNITGESGWEGLVCASPQPVRDPPQRELSPLSGCPAATSYLTTEHSHGPAASLPWLHRESRSMEGIRTERSSQSLTWG
ncbi:hypothetical protein CesoFtcFv8_017533 [Champsocephalus esox]|uniref:Uncharacterized protein n=1 Tax=Champsocephalus esox TaxID=159716 RepID=A0AAN8GNZ3_9TELE|nr:hypothetical protein CesoFtcFv8_017533 [Champsocephalus esox]